MTSPRPRTEAGSSTPARSDAAPRPRGLTRRRALGVGAGAAAAGVLAGAGGAYAAGRAGVPVPGAGQGHLDSVVPFRGEHQAGIVTPAQDRLHFVALDVTTDDRDELVDLLRRWTVAAERMSRGEPADPGGISGGGPWQVPEDTGEAFGLPASSLTVTVGFGPSLFDGRFALAGARPDGLAELPPFGGDELDPARSGGDLCIQACADDPQVAVHAVRNLVRMGFGTVSVRWSQLGFGRTSSTSRAQQTPRNMFGFKDGTANLKAEEEDALERHVWVQPGDVPGRASWLAGGSYLVARRIRMHIEVWDRSPLQDQEDTIGRTKREGAPLGRSHEFDALDLDATGADGEPAIPVDAHVRLAHRSNLGGIEILRRGYNFTDGVDGVGHLDAGLFFIAFCRDAHAQFVPMQQALAANDAMNEYIVHDGSAVFACPPGPAPGEHWGQSLFTA